MLNQTLAFDADIQLADGWIFPAPNRWYWVDSRNELIYFPDSKGSICVDRRYQRLEWLRTGRESSKHIGVKEIDITKGFCVIVNQRFEEMLDARYDQHYRMRFYTDRGELKHMVDSEGRLAKNTLIRLAFNNSIGKTIDAVWKYIDTIYAEHMQHMASTSTRVDRNPKDYGPIWTQNPRDVEEKLYERFNGMVLKLDIKGMLWHGTGFNIPLCLRTVPFQEQREFVKNNRRGLVQYAIDGLSSRKSTMRRIGDFKYYEATEIILRRDSAVEIHFDLKKGIQRVLDSDNKMEDSHK